jgi:hypothetical protein
VGEKRRDSGDRIGWKTPYFERGETCRKYVPEPGLID